MAGVLTRMATLRLARRRPLEAWLELLLRQLGPITNRGRRFRQRCLGCPEADYARHSGGRPNVAVLSVGDETRTHRVDDGRGSGTPPTFPHLIRDAGDVAWSTNTTLSGACGLRAPTGPVVSTG